MSNNNSKLRERYNPEGSDLRKAQLRMVEMLRFVDYECKKHDIVYWIDYGTLLGAARHGGFIPWDDDVDICMTRDNLIKFRKVMKTNPSSQFVLQNHDTDSGYYRFWDVVRDLKSEYVHIPDIPMEHSLKYRGLQVDIFPFEDRINYNYYRFVGKIQNALIYYPLLEKKYFRFLKFMVPFNFNVIRYVLIPIGNCIGKLFPKRDYLMMSYGNQFTEKKVREDIFPLGSISFEGVELRCPKEYDKVLTAYYGNWRKVPDDDQIKTHGVKFVFK